MNCVKRLQIIIYLLRVVLWNIITNQLIYLLALFSVINVYVCWYLFKFMNLYNYNRLYTFLLHIDWIISRLIKRQHIHSTCLNYFNCFNWLIYFVSRVLIIL